MVVLKSVGLVGKGLVSGTKYHYNHMCNLAQAPTFLVYQVTNNCNSRCMMCNIWKKESKGELSIDEIKSIFKKKELQGIRWINLTGGEPFVRNDLSEIVKKLNRLPKLEGIAIPTNGFLTQRTVKNAEEMLKALKKGRFLSITVSIDGFEKTHDAMRGVPGAYKKAMETLEKLNELKVKYPNFNVGVQPTITKRNLDEIEDFYRHIKTKAKSVGFAVMLESEGYYDNKDSSVSLTVQDKNWIAGFLDRSLRNDPQYSFYYKKLIHMFRTGRRNFGCLAGFTTLFMDPFGRISPCPILSSDKRYCFGNIRDEDVWFTKKAKNIRKRLKKEPICKKCTLMCDFISVVKVEFFTFAFFLMQHPIISARLVKKAKELDNTYL